MFNMKVYLEESKYIEQYHNAIFKLMNESDIRSYIYPLISLIHQTIENELKSLIVEAQYDEKTFTELQVSNTHDLAGLVKNQNLLKYYDKINEFEKIFSDYSKVVIYFYNLLSKNTFLDSRYPIEKAKNEITSKKDVNIAELYSNWTKYSELYVEINSMYIAYCNANIIIDLKNHGKTNKEISIFKKSIITDLENNFGKEYSEIILLYIEKYVNRNKYFDQKYSNNNII